MAQVPQRIVNLAAWDHAPSVVHFIKLLVFSG
jgi:hypothetical protein